MPARRPSPRGNPGPGAAGFGGPGAPAESIRRDEADLSGLAFEGDAGMLQVDAVASGPESGHRRGRAGLSITAWVAIGWMTFVVLIAVLAKTGLVTWGDPQNSIASCASKGPFAQSGTAPGHLLGCDSIGRDMAARLALGAWESLLVSVRGSHARVRGRRRARARRRLLRRQDRLVLYRHLQRAAVGAGHRARVGAGRLPPGEPRERGEEHAARLGRADHRDRDRVDPAGRANIPGQRAQLESSATSSWPPAPRAPRTAGSWSARCCRTSPRRCSRSRCSASRSRSWRKATLAILGVGVRPPTPSWGNIIALDRGLLLTSPHIVFEAVDPHLPHRAGPELPR